MKLISLGAEILQYSFKVISSLNTPGVPHLNSWNSRNWKLYEYFASVDKTLGFPLRNLANSSVDAPTSITISWLDTYIYFFPFGFGFCYGNSFMMKDNIKWPNAKNVEDSWSYKISRESLISQLEVFRVEILINTQFSQLQEKNTRVWPNQKEINTDGPCKFWGLQQTKWRASLQVLCDWMCSYYFYSIWNLLRKPNSGVSDVTFCL